MCTQEKQNPNEDIVVTDNAKIADILNKHFIRASILFQNHVSRPYIKKNETIKKKKKIIKIKTNHLLVFPYNQLISYRFGMNYVNCLTKTNCSDIQLEHCKQ